MFLNKQSRNKQTKPLDQCPVFILNEGPYVSLCLPLSPIMFPSSARLSSIRDNCPTAFLLLKPPTPPWLHPFPALDLVPYFTEKTNTPRRIVIFPRRHAYPPNLSGTQILPSLLPLPTSPSVHESQPLIPSHTQLSSSFLFCTVQHHISSIHANMLKYVLSQTNTKKPFPFSHCPTSLHSFIIKCMHMMSVSITSSSLLPDPQESL